MSLSFLLPEDGVTDLLSSWPEEPRIYRRDTGRLDRVITADIIDEYVHTGCVPAAEIAVVKAPGPSLNEKAYTTGGRTDPEKLRSLHESGYTIRAGNLQRVLPALAHMCREIHRESGCSTYVHAFLTPPGGQGLSHHWDQQMGVIAQIAGVKRWRLWRPPVEAPMREYNESWRVWRHSFVLDWEATGPDLEIDLRAGQSLLLPRGWVHAPRVLDASGRSVHLTFALRERTPVWLAEKLVAGVIEDPGFRRVVPPGDINGPGLVQRLHETRRALVAYLEGLDDEEFAEGVRRAAGREAESGG